MRRSHALKLAAAFAGVGIGAAALTAILVNLAFGVRFSSYLDQQRTAHREEIVAALRDSYTRMGDWDVSDLQSLTSLALMDGGTLQLLDANGTPVWDASRGPGAALSQMHRDMMDAGPLGAPTSVPIFVDGSQVGTGLVRLPESGLLPQDRAFRSSVNQLLLVGGIVAGLFAMGLGIVLSRRAVRPARQLTQAAEAAADGDRSLRLESSSSDEFGDMARAFNRMAETIEREDQLRRAFSADVAHELRTPLMILRSQIEGMQDGVVETDGEALGSLHDETLRMGRLVADLETLASAEAAGFSLSPSRTDLAALARDAAREFAGPAESRGIELRSSLEEVVAPVDATRIRQVVANLLSNALKFTPTGGVVTLSVAIEGGVGVIRVADSGPGIPDEELPLVFDRFFRGRDVRAGGSGVGLTVAQELIRAHGGELSAASPPGGGAVFEVRLPVATHQPHNGFTASSQPPARLNSKGATR
jgi:two-component system sensor histidine kinase BaeS